MGSCCGKSKDKNAGNTDVNTSNVASQTEADSLIAGSELKTSNNDSIDVKINDDNKDATNENEFNNPYHFDKTSIVVLKTIKKSNIGVKCEIIDKKEKYLLYSNGDGNGDECQFEISVNSIKNGDTYIQLKSIKYGGYIEIKKEGIIKRKMVIDCNGKLNDKNTYFRYYISNVTQTKLESLSYKNNYISYDGNNVIISDENDKHSMFKIRRK